MKLSHGSRWYDANMNFYQVSNIWYENERDLWVQYTNKLGQAFTCRAEAFVNRFSYTAAK
jgi:hypothetical protein